MSVHRTAIVIDCKHFHKAKKPAGLRDSVTKVTKHIKRHSDRYIAHCGWIYIIAYIHRQ